MALNITEAIHVQTVLGYVLGDNDDQYRAMTAAVALAETARKRLGAGPSGEHVREAWADLLLPGKRGVSS